MVFMALMMSKIARPEQMQNEKYSTVTVPESRKLYWSFMQRGVTVATTTEG